MFDETADLTWLDLVDPGSVEVATQAGARVLDWAVDVHERFFGDAWLHRAASERFRTVPFMALGLWPVQDAGSVFRLVERACQLALCEQDWEGLRSQVWQNGPAEAATHLRLVVEIASWGRREGMAAVFEPEVGQGKRPDVLLGHPDGRQVLVEVTSQKQDKGMRAVETYGRRVQDLTWVVERTHGVVVTVVSEESLLDGDVDAWFEDVNRAATRVGAGDPAEEVRWGDNVATIHPHGTHVTTIHDGPSLTGDAWPRIENRIRQKALQTRGGPPAWIRIEVDSSLFALSTLATLEPIARLRALAGNVATVLAVSPHVLGVILGPPPGLGEPGNTRLLLAEDLDSSPSGMVLPPSVVREPATASGPTAVRCTLPGGWVRNSFVLPNPTCEAMDPLHPGMILAREGEWLDWALDHLGKPQTADIIR